LRAILAVLFALGAVPGASAAGPVHVSGHAAFGYGGSVHVSGGYWGSPYWAYPYWGHGYPYWGHGYPYWGYGPYGYAYPPPRVWVGEGMSSPPAVLETHVQPKRAEVWIDGMLAGQARDFTGTWDRLWIEPGRHEIELRKAGYRTLRLALDLAPGGRARIEERLEQGEGIDRRSAEPAAAPAEVASGPTPATPPALRRALLRLEVEPADAAVYLDGEFLAHGAELSRLHGAIPVAEGSHRVEVVRPGYSAERQEIEVSAEQPLHVRISLRRAEPG
jgi:hypothetical protein